MLAIVSGEGLGLATSSLYTLGAQGRLGDPKVGRGNDRVYLNVANGNLMVQALDEHLAGSGLAIDSLRTYNSQAKLNGANALPPLQPGKLQVQGGLNSPVSRITRLDVDGSSSLFVLDASGQAWMNTDGSGAYDVIRYDKSAGELVFTDGATGITEHYQRWRSDWILLARVDPDGNRISYSYDSQGNLVSVTNANGEGSWYDYSGTVLTQVRTVTKDGAGRATAVRVRYGYDSFERVTSVSVDLTPADGSIADGKTYVTRYAYEGASNRMSAMWQDDGTALYFSYVKIGPDYCVSSVTNALGEVTQLQYGSGSTTVIDPLGLATRYDYDITGQLLRITGPAVNGKPQVTSFVWNARGDLVQVTDALGQVTSMEYDVHGNLVLQRDAAGNVITRCYSPDNLLLAETRWLAPDPDGNGPQKSQQGQTTHYIYDAAGHRHLRFTVSPEGRVTEYRYNATGQLTSQLNYAAPLEDASAWQVSYPVALPPPPCQFLAAHSPPLPMWAAHPLKPCWQSGWPRKTFARQCAPISLGTFAASCSSSVAPPVLMHRACPWPGQRSR